MKLSQSKQQPQKLTQAQPKPQAEEIIVIVKSNIGMNRVTLSSEQTIAQLYQQLSTIVSSPPESLIVYLENKLLNQPPTTKLNRVPLLQMGASLKVDINPKFKSSSMQIEQPKQVLTASGKVVTKEQLQQHESHLKKSTSHQLTQYCLHPPEAKCVNCLEKTEDKPEINKKKCAHGPTGKCLNCTEIVDANKEKQVAKKLLCQHGPTGKCTHCIDDGQLSNVKHVSFDEYLAESKAKCKGAHPIEGKCNNCLPPTAISYKVKRDCKNHAPFPKAMCNSCLPPSVVLKQQAYRHVDYVEFLNIPEMSSFVQYWSSKGKSEQRVGFLYGYYAEDPNYKNGVRAIVEAIYEPPQKGQMGSVEFQLDDFERQVNQISTFLGLERIGWIFTTINHDCFLSSGELRQAARLQKEFNVVHSSGYKVSKFLTVVLRTKKDNVEEVLPEVYMVSDQFQQLEEDCIFEDSGRRKVLKVREPKTEEDIVPNFIYQGKSVKEFEPDFFIVNVAHGYNPQSNYNILKLYDFPVENRSEPQKTLQVKQFLHKHQKKQSFVKYADFHLLLYLSKLIDFDVIQIHNNMFIYQTAARIAQQVGNEEAVDTAIEEVIKMYANQS